jgi:predicted nucleotidyltransferase
MKVSARVARLGWNREKLEIPMETRETETLDSIVRRVVEVAQPDRVYLFGSAARGDMDPDSDVDLLVIKKGAHRRKLTQEIYRHLIGSGRAVDIVVVTPEDIENYKSSPLFVIGSAVREGREVYAA